MTDSGWGVENEKLFAEMIETWRRNSKREIQLHKKGI